jgi:hypothetical protein
MVGNLKIGESQSRLAWAKTKTLSPKITRAKRLEAGANSRVSVLQAQRPEFKPQYCPSKKEH